MSRRARRGCSEGSVTRDSARRRARRAVLTAGLATGAVLVLAAATPHPGTPTPWTPVPPPAPPPGRVLDQVVVPRVVDDLPGTTFRELTTTIPGPGGGRIRGTLIQADLTGPVHVDLLRPGAVAATAPVAAMAGPVSAIAGVNGDFFDEGGTGAPVGVQLAGEVPRSSGVPIGRRPAPPVPPGESPDTVIGVDTAGVARIGRVLFGGTARWGTTTVGLRALNAYVVPVDGVGVFTPAWGGVPRARTTCGSDVSAAGGCSRDVIEVRVANGHVVAIGAPGAGTLPTGTIALVGRDAGAAPLRALRIGAAIDVRYGMEAPDTPPLRAALGAIPLVRGGRALAGLQTSERAPRTAVGLTEGGRRLWLVAVDGRQEASVGATLAQLGRLMTDLGVTDAVALDGGGSTTMIRRGRGGPLRVVDHPSDNPPRSVADGLAVLPGR